MSPGIHVKPHCGTTDGRIRLHLGLQIPRGVEFVVGNQTRRDGGWTEGEVTVFDDSYEHEIIHR